MKEATHIERAGFAIRDYRPEDFELLWRIDQRCFPAGISYSQSDLDSFIADRDAVTLVAEFSDTDSASGDRIAGFVVAHATGPGYGRVLTLDVVPEARRFGLGSRLMNACEERLRALECKEVYLETAVNNEAALRLYRKLGYEVLRVLPQYYSSHSLDAFQMGKKL